MGKFLLGVIVGAVVAVLGLVIIGFAVGRLFGNKQPVIAPNAVLVLALSGEVPESAPFDFSFSLGQNQATPTVRDVWTSLHAAASDNKIKALLIQPKNLSVGWARLQELKREIVNFKKSGKPVYALLQGAGSREYYLSTAADRIFISPDDLLDVKGFRVEEMFFKNTLDKLGVGVQVDHIGRYKDAGDTFSRTSMTPETREVLNQILDQLYGDFCSTVGASRHKSVDDVKTLIDSGPFMAQQAKAMGLVDELGYEDEVFSALKKKTGINDLNKVALKSYFRAAPSKGDRIAMLVGDGDIVRGGADDSTTNQSVISSGTFSKVIRQVREDSSIKGVILRVNSPGGDAVASDEILHELKLLSTAKPLVVSMSDVAASGGYFISMTGDQVLSYPNTITGSIGVLYVRPYFRNLYDKFGVQQETITRGKLADYDSLYNPLSDAAKEKLHDSIDTTYHSFVSKVATARRKTYSQIDQLAQGRVWMGSQARENALVDDLGGLDEAIASIRRKAKLSAGGDTNLVMFPPRRGLLDVLTSASPEAVTEEVAWKKVHSIAPSLPRTVLPSPALLKGGVLRILPYQLSIQ